MKFFVSKPHSDESGVTKHAFKIFLAGTIDMGNSENWQTKMAQKISNKINEKFKDEKSYFDTLFDGQIVFYNPRRDEGFDTENKAEIEYQIKWELDRIDAAHLVVMNILPDSKSPISLLELGMCCASNKSFCVICPKSFYRYDNVIITCKRHKVPVFETVEDFLDVFQKEFI